MLQIAEMQAEQLDNGRWRGHDCPVCKSKRTYKTKKGAKLSASSTCKSCWGKTEKYKARRLPVPGHELPGGKWRLPDCPRCSRERIYRDKWSADNNKNRETCKKCRGVIWIEIGTKFGNWLVIGGPEFNVGGCKSLPNGYVKWMCRCTKCGIETLVIGSNLLRGGSRGCNNCKKLPRGQANFNASYFQKKKSAKERNLEWELDEAQFAFLVSQPCVYCGELHSNNHKVLRGEFRSNGIDRISSSAGYILGNVTSCCKACNYAKRKMTTREFAQWISEVSDHPDGPDAIWNKWAERIRTITKTLLYVCELGNGCLGAGLND